MHSPGPHLHASSIEGGVRDPRRHDSAHKHVTGEAVYTDDIPEPPGTLQVFIAQSTRAHASIVKLDLSKVRAAPGVVRVLTAEDIPGANDVSPFAGDDPMFAESLVQYYGQSIFAVAAETVDKARAAARLAIIEYEDLPLLYQSTRQWTRRPILRRPTRCKGATPMARSLRPRIDFKGGFISAGRSTFIWKAKSLWPFRARTRMFSFMYPRSTQLKFNTKSQACSACQTIP